jgi:zinc transporter ZupT
MILSGIILFVSALAGGLLIYLFPEQKGNGFRLSLIFAGAYLFSITIVHIIPEIYSHPLGGLNVGIFMLLGYFIQQILEYFSAGIEHGHLHHKGHNHQHTGMGILSVLIALCIHAFLEGGMLAYPSNLHATHEHNTLLVGIVLHKIPAAYALMSIITCTTWKRGLIFLMLFTFAIASPLGLWLSDYTSSNQLVSERTTLILFALVCGSFLQISTTIVFESSPQHKFDLKRFGIAVAGAITAIISELL